MRQRSRSDQLNLLGTKFRRTLESRHQAAIPVAAIITIGVVVEATPWLEVEEVRIAAVAQLAELAPICSHGHASITSEAVGINQDPISFFRIEVTDHVGLATATVAGPIEQEAVGPAFTGETIPSPAGTDQVIITSPLHGIPSTALTGDDVVKRNLGIVQLKIVDAVIDG